MNRANEALVVLGSETSHDDLEAFLSLFDELEDVADETEDVLSSADLLRLAQVVDWSELPDAVELENVPDAIEERDPTEVVALRELLDVEDLPELWRSLDARELWRQKREFDDELEDLPLVGADGDDGDGELLDASGSDVDLPDVDAHDVDPRSVENAVQAQMSDAVATAREALLDAHDRVEALYEENESRFPDRRRNRTRNPSAVSTLPDERASHGPRTRHSTVPEETRHSTAPNRRRIYGTRFDSRGDADAG